MAYKFLLIVTLAVIANAQHEHYAHEEYDDHPKYEFSYDVKDEHTGDYHSQQESRDGEITKGFYSLIDADGYKRTVEYTVDGKSGFNAVVHREPTGHAPAPAAATKHQAPQYHVPQYQPQQGHQAPHVHQAPQIQQVPQVHRAPQMYQAPQAPQIYQAPQVNHASKMYQATQVQQAHEAPKHLIATQKMQAPLVQLATQAHMVPQMQQAPRQAVPIYEASKYVAPQQFTAPKHY